MPKITKFRIQRSDPTHGILYQRMWDGSEEPISTPMEYSKCMMFIQEKQKELKIWRISAIGPRRNAVRHKRMDIFAEDKNEALEAFDRFLSSFGDDNVTYELCTGDWRIIANRRPGQPIIIL